MKIFFRLLLVVSLSMAYLSSNAQSLIVKGGLSMSNMTIKDDNVTYSDDFKTKTGFHIGIAGELPLFGGVMFEPGLMFATKGYKVDLGDVSVSLNYIDIPLNLKYKLDIGDFAVWGSVGSYVGIGLSGKHKMTLLGKDVENDVKFGEDEDFKMLDYGLGFGAGVEYHRIILGVYYNIGLANISNIDLANHKTNNKVFNISLGYRIGGE